MSDPNTPANKMTEDLAKLVASGQLPQPSTDPNAQNPSTPATNPIAPAAPAPAANQTMDPKKLQRILDAVRRDLDSAKRTIAHLAEKNNETVALKESHDTLVTRIDELKAVIMELQAVIQAADLSSLPAELVAIDATLTALTEKRQTAAPVDVKGVIDSIQDQVKLALKPEFDRFDQALTKVQQTVDGLETNQNSKVDAMAKKKTSPTTAASATPSQAASAANVSPSATTAVPATPPQTAPVVPATPVNAPPAAATTAQQTAPQTAPAGTVQPPQPPQNPASPPPVTPAPAAAAPQGNPPRVRRATNAPTDPATAPASDIGAVPPSSGSGGGNVPPVPPQTTRSALEPMNLPPRVRQANDNTWKIVASIAALLLVAIIGIAAYNNGLLTPNRQGGGTVNNGGAPTVGSKLPDDMVPGQWYATGNSKTVPKGARFDTSPRSCEREGIEGKCAWKKRI